MKKYSFTETILLIIELIFLALVIIAVTILFSSCCRPATDFQVRKWESKHKFESPKQFLRISPFKKKYTTKY